MLPTPTPPVPDVVRTDVVGPTCDIRKGALPRRDPGIPRRIRSSPPKVSTLVPRESVDSNVGFPGTVRAGSEAGPGGGGVSADAGDAVNSISAPTATAAEYAGVVEASKFPVSG